MVLLIATLFAVWMVAMERYVTHVVRRGGAPARGDGPPA
jgi:hypothetical protein